MKTPNPRARGVVCLTIAAALCSHAPSASFGGKKDAAPPAIQIFDENGRTPPSAPRGPGGQTVTVMVGQTGLTFTPSSVNIVAGDTVHWVFAAAGHTVTSGTPSCTVDSSYCSPSNTSCTTAPTSAPGATFDHTFAQAGTFSYFCRIHCGLGMKGTVNVAAPFITIVSAARGANGHFLVAGQTLANRTIHLESSPDLVTVFGNGVAVTADAMGAFQYDDPGASALATRFYRAIYP